MSNSSPDHHIQHPLQGPEWHLWGIVVSKIIAKAWVDSSFKQRLIDEPEAVLVEYELNIPEGMTVEVADGATEWSMSGTALSGVGKFVLPIPPKPDVDDVLQGWADGDTGHPPLLSGTGSVMFAGLPSGGADAAARRIVEARRVGDGRRVTDAAARRMAEARRIVDDSDISAIADAAARRVAEARRITDHPGIEAIVDAAARRVAEARRIVDDGTDAAAQDAAARRTAEARRIVDDGDETDEAE